MTDSGSRRKFWLLMPLLVFFGLFVAAPLLLLAGVSLFDDAAMTQTGVGQYVKFLGDGFNRGILFETLGLAFSAVVISMLIGYPVAYAYVLLVRLGREGLINQSLLSLGLIAAPLKLLYTQGAVAIAVAQIEVPMMILPLISSMSAIDPQLRHASTALGAGHWRTFRQIIFPLSVPGLLAGTLLVFTASASAFVTQTLVGGGRMIFMPFYIYQQAIQSQNYPFAATITMVLLASVLGIVSLINFLGRKSVGFIHG